MQCYVCSKSCHDYSHFNDSARGGKAGNCPLFDDVEQRHQTEVQAAEERARQKVAEENPDVDADLLKIKFSESVKKGDERRKVAAAVPGVHRRALLGPPPIPHPYGALY
jgi:TRIAD3 protein (E3 ubiquitin-protein ligase RNF216)